MKFGMMSLLDHYPEDKSEEQYYKDFFTEVDYAEELGFDSMWVGEHHFCNYVCPSPQILAMAIAQRTKKMRIGTAVALLPHHDPIRLAEDYAMLDLLSGGRLDFGVGRGFIKLIYDVFNQSMDESRDRFGDTFDAQMVHREQAPHRTRGLVAVPAAERLRVEPGAALEVVADALQPLDAGGVGLAAGIDVAARPHQLVRVHRGVSDEQDLPAVVEAPQQVARRQGIAAEQSRVAVDVFVDAVVEVVAAQLAQPLHLTLPRSPRPGAKARVGSDPRLRLPA